MHLHIFNKQKNISWIVFIVVSIIALHSLYFIFKLSVNVPYWDEWDLLGVYNTFLNGDTSSWIHQAFSQVNEHRPFFPFLILSIMVKLTSWNAVATTYLNWILVGLSLVPIYLFLKRLKKNFVLLLIPIAIIMYSPSQWENLLWDIQFLLLLKVCAFLWSIYFLNSKDKYFLPAVGAGVIASFSQLLGLLIWPLGILPIVFLKNRRKVFLTLWLSSAVLVFITYFYGWHEVGGHSIFQQIDFNKYVQYVLVFLGSPFPTHNLAGNELVGSILLSILAVGVSIIWVREKKISSQFLPWFQIGLYGFFAALITGIGRYVFGIETAAESRYITESNLLSISAIVFFSIIMIELWSRVRTKKTRLILLSCICLTIIVGGTTLSYSYADGWKSATINSRIRNDAMSCFSLPLIFDRCTALFYTPERLPALINQLMALHIGPFHYLDSAYVRGVDKYFDKKNWLQLPNVKGYGSVENVNGISTSNVTNIPISEPIVTITGWMLDDNKKEVDHIYLFIDGNPFMRLDKFPRIPELDGKSQDEQFKIAMKMLWDKRLDLQERFPEVENGNYTIFKQWVLNEKPADLLPYIKGNFVPRPDILKIVGSDADLNSGWKMSFFSGHLTKVCHRISIGTITSDGYIIIPSKADICEK